MEVYPSDNELLNLVSDEDTGVEYIATGQSPYYLQFRKMLYRLLLSTKISNGLRVYDEGGLEIGIKPGGFWAGNECVGFAGGFYNLADDKANIYVYIDSAGNAVTDEYTGFPDMNEQGHIRLAKVSTSSGDIVSIEDYRVGHNLSIPFGAGGIKRVVEAHTADDTLSEFESGSVHSNAGASGVVTITLPGSVCAGCEFVFAVQCGQELRVDPGSGCIYDSSGQTADKYKSANSIGACMTVISDGAGGWIVTGKSGIWTEEA